MAIQFRLHQHKHSNKLIEEFMLLANMAVARKIYTSFPALSVLRRHPPPKGPFLDILLASLQSLGVVIDRSSAGAIGQSIAAQAGVLSVLGVLKRTVCPRSLVHFHKVICYLQMDKTFFTSSNYSLVSGC